MEMPVSSDVLTLILIALSAVILLRGCDRPHGYDAGAVMFVPDEYWI